MEQETVWIIAVVALAVGVLIGFLMGRSGSGEPYRKTLEAELRGSRAEMDRYKKEVTQHFEQTASLVNELTDQYRKVHQHLATGAQSLCPDQTAGRSLQSSLQPKLDKGIGGAMLAQEATGSTLPMTETNQSAKPSAEPLEPPKDWAPKKPDDEGTLSDRYGLKKKPETSITPPLPDPGLHEEDNDKR